MLFACKRIKIMLFTGFFVTLHLLVRVALLCLYLVQSRTLGRAVNKADQRISELQVLIEELQWDMEKIRRRENRLNAHLSEILERVRMMMISIDVNECLFMLKYDLTLLIMHLRWTAKAIKSVGRPAVYVEPLLLTRER